MMGAFSREFSKREKALLFVLALLVLAALYYFFVQEPVRSTCDNAKMIIEERSMENEILAAQGIKKRQMLEEIGSITEDSNAQEVPVYDNVSRLTAFLNLALKDSYSYDIKCGDVEYDQETGVFRRPVQISCVVDNYYDGEQLIRTISTCPYCSQINGAVFTPYNDNDVPHEQRINNIEDANVELDLTMTFYEKR